MKLGKLLLGSLASLALLVGCDNKEEDLGAPSIKLNPETLTFALEGGEQTVALTSTRDWTVADLPEWLSVSPTSGKASNDAQTITLTALKNEETDRNASLEFKTGLVSATLKVSQSGPGGSVEASYVYSNNFDKEDAVKGENGWNTYLDSFEGWKNQTGSGIEAWDFAAQSMTARTSTGNSASQYSDYEGSGHNYLWFGSGTPYFILKNLKLDSSKKDYTLSFGAERNQFIQGQEIDNTFNHEEFKVYVSNDGNKWVELAYTFAKGTDPNRRWDLASSTFTVPAGTEVLYIYMASNVGSAYAVDDLSLAVSPKAGTAVDFNSGVELPGGGGAVTPGPGPDGPYTTIADIRKVGEGALADNTFIKAVVVSSIDLNNLTSKKNVYVQDETAGIQIRFNEDNKVWKFGAELSINLSGQTLSMYNGALQVNNLPLNRVTVLNAETKVEAKNVTVADFMANKYECQYVAIPDVQVVAADLEKTFVVGEAHTGITIESKDGNTFEVFSSKFSNFKDQKVPQGSGTLKGIASSNNGKIQIIFGQDTDWSGLTGERFDAADKPVEVKKATVAEFLSASVGDGVYYELTGQIQNIENEVYGNFDLVDETGTVYVYGLTKEKSSTNDKSFASLGLKEGDIVTLAGTRDEFSGSPQVGGPAYYISHKPGELAPYLKVDKTSLNASAAAGSVKFTVSSNVEWTVSSDNASFTVNPDKGNGTAEITVSYPENTKAEEVVANIKVTTTNAQVATKEYTVKVTQAAKPSGDVKTDVLKSDMFTATAAQYADFSNVTAASGAVYAGNSAKHESGAIQLRSKSNAGIVSTKSAGKVRKVNVVWEASTLDKRVLNIYCSNEPFASAADLYKTGVEATVELKMGETTVDIPGDFQYVGLRSKDGAMYLTEIEIVWE